MSDTQVSQGTAVSMDKVLEKLKNRISEQIVQIAMLEAFIDQIQETSQTPQVSPRASEAFREVNKTEDD